MIFTTLAFQLLLLGLAGLPLVSGNVEKEIFVAPRANDGQYLELEALHLSLPRVNPSSLCGTSPCRSLKTTLNTSFLDGGERQWVLLDHLKPGKRYEVRICWAATSPTDFILNLHTPHQLLSDPSLITGLMSYDSQPSQSLRTVDEVDHAAEVPQSLLYLEIQAKAGYYTYDKPRMDNPDTVDIEIILDPYFMNIFPESLFLIAGMTILVALLAWWGSGRLYIILQNIGATEVTSNKEQGKKDS